MTAWLNPAAFALLSALALPLLIHLLLRRRSVRVPFPTLRFIDSSDQSAARFERPSDVTLLIVRGAIVAAAALAVARPLQLTDQRRQAWMDRTTRAIVVDTSTSVDVVRAGEAAAAERQGTIATRRFDSTSLPGVLARASSWLERAQPSRREIVVISDFQRGALTQADLATVPDDIGVRLLPVQGGSMAGATFEAAPIFHDGQAFARMVSVDDDVTRVTLRNVAPPPGLEIEAPLEAAQRVHRAIRVAGAVAPSADEPIVVRFGQRLESRPAADWTNGWMRDAVWRLLALPGARGVDLRASPAQRGLLIDVGSQADSLAAAEIVQAALNARQDPRPWTEREPARIAPSVLASWTRSPSPTDPTPWQNTTESDGRWLWLGAILLMVLESLLRRQRARRVAPLEAAHAA